MGDEGPSPFDDLPELTDSQPGEQTRAVIMNAGIHRHKAKNRQLTLLIVGAVLVAGTVVGLDATGVLQILPEKMVPTLAGAEEPKQDVARNERSAEPSALRDTLLGMNDAAPEPAAPSPSPAKDQPAPLSARSLFEDDAKAPAKLSLSAESVRTQVALPDGLTGDAIATVIQDNSGGARLCIAEAMKAGETKGGKAEFDVTIAPSGEVETVETRAGAGGRMSACMQKTIKRWRFPSFDGEPVVVVIPYVITPGI